MYFIRFVLDDSYANGDLAVLTFYVQTWDEYHTKTLTLGIISGPVEGLIILCLVYGFTGYVGGGSFWTQSMMETVGIPKLEFIPNYLYKMPFNEWYMIQGGLVLVYNTISR
jgi:ethanolaminephosphotransferase